MLGQVKVDELSNNAFAQDKGSIEFEDTNSEVEIGENLSNRLRINLNELDAELANQPSMFYNWCMQYSKAKRRVAQIEAKIKQVRADLKSHAKSSDGVVLKGIKPTIENVADFVEKSPLLQKLNMELITAQFIMDKCYSIKEAFAQRCDMLKGLKGVR